MLSPDNLGCRQVINVNFKRFEGELTQLNIPHDSSYLIINEKKKKKRRGPCDTAVVTGETFCVCGEFKTGFDRDTTHHFIIVYFADRS